MAATQAGLGPGTRRIPPSLFAIAFGLAVLWITYTKPAGATGYAIAVVTLITVLIAAIAGRTMIALARGQFLPAPPAHSPTEQP